MILKQENLPVYKIQSAKNESETCVIHRNLLMKKEKEKEVLKGVTQSQNSELFYMVEVEQL